jgi:hypothetical protein
MPKTKKKPITKSKSTKKVNLPTPEAFIISLRKLLVHHTFCDVQNGWPCGTCFLSTLSEVLDNTNPEYHNHNEPIDRDNEVWRAILQIRELDPLYQKNKASETCNAQI